jgi:hypothetical protein
MERKRPCKIKFTNTTIEILYLERIVYSYREGASVADGYLCLCLKYSQTLKYLRVVPSDPGSNNVLDMLNMQISNCFSAAKAGHCEPVVGSGKSDPQAISSVMRLDGNEMQMLSADE